MSFLTKRNLILAGGAFILALAGTLIAIREPMQPLTRADLERAREKWSQQALSSYQIQYDMHGSRYDVSVRPEGRIEVLVNDRPPTGSNYAPFVVEGLFETLEMELDNLESPTGPFAGRQDGVLMRVRFHPELGYVERYLRSSGGYGKGVSISVADFQTPIPVDR